jgi:hypothetical protein
VPRPGAERSEKPPSIDSARARMFFRPCPAPCASPSKPSPSSLIVVRQALLDDAEDLDLLVGRQADRLVDLELDVEGAVGGQELHVAPQRRVERRVARRGREREDREAGLLLRELRRLLEPWCDLLHRRPRLEQAGVRRDGEEVLRETVVDLTRHARPLLGDGAAELGGADRAPGADEDDAVREHAEEVTLRDIVAGEHGLEDEVQGGEEHQGEAEREPAGEVLAVAEEARAPTDAGDQRHECLERERAGEIEGLRVRGRRRQRRQRRPERAQQRPRDEEADPDRRDGVRDRPVAVLATAVRERRGREQRRAGDRADQRRPALGGLDLVAAEARADAEGHRRERGDEEPAREQQVDPAAVGRVAGGTEDGDE